MPRRSDQRARLKKAHHNTTANARPRPHIIPSEKPLIPGMTAFTPNLATNRRTTATTPGQTRSGFRRVGSAVCAVVMLKQYAGYQPFVPWFLAGFKSSASGVPAEPHLLEGAVCPRSLSV
jgi:hypothetical protein